MYPMAQVRYSDSHSCLCITHIDEIDNSVIKLRISLVPTKIIIYTVISFTRFLFYWFTFVPGRFWVGSH